MIKSTFVESDATIYNDIPTLNTGLDEILEIRKSFLKINVGTLTETTAVSASIARPLIKFDITDISSSVASGRITNPAFYLKLSTTHADRMKIKYNLEAHPVSQDWQMGMGNRFANPIIIDGVSWNFTDGVTPWVGGLPVDTTLQGGTWAASPSASQAFSYETSDILMDVTQIVNAWISGSTPNYGFILKFPAAFEADGNEYGSLNFFSRDTHTIYPPLLQVKWDDSSYATGSLALADINHTLISMNQLKAEYKTSEVARVDVFARGRYPARAFVTSSRYLIGQALPQTSYYSVMDAHTEEVLIPFDVNSTKLSCDGTINYFNFDMSGLQPERYYKFVLKVENTANTIILDDKFYFKVGR